MKRKDTLFLAIGISGSGKTWYFRNKIREDFLELDKYLSDNNLDISDIIVSPDEMRKELTGNISDFSQDSYIWTTLVYIRTKEKLKEHGFCVFDATSVSRRKSFLKEFNDVEKIGLIFKPDVKLSNERIRENIKNNIDRSDVPLEIIEKQYEKFKHSVIYYKWNGVWDSEIKNKIKDRLLIEEDLKIKFV